MVISYPDPSTWKSWELPKSRPLCGASETVNMELYEDISLIIEAALEAQEQREIISTEELLAKVDRLKCYLCLKIEV